VAPACKAVPVEDRTPGDGAQLAGQRDPDPLVDELQRERRDRRVLVIAAAVGIISGAVIGMAFVLGAIGDDAGRAHGWLRNHGVVFLILGSPLVSMAIGYAIYGVRRRRR
jgi:hypothetical protein